MIWLAIGVAAAGYFVGYGLCEIGEAIAAGVKMLAETEVEVE